MEISEFQGLHVNEEANETADGRYARIDPDMYGVGIDQWTKLNRVMEEKEENRKGKRSVKRPPKHSTNNFLTLFHP